MSVGQTVYRIANVRYSNASRDEVGLLELTAGFGRQRVVRFTVKLLEIKSDDVSLHSQEDEVDFARDSSLGSLHVELHHQVN